MVAAGKFVLIHSGYRRLTACVHLLAWLRLAGSAPLRRSGPERLADVVGQVDVFGEAVGRLVDRFISDLASRLRYRVQMTTDGHRPYLEAIESSFGKQVDYAMLVKLYGNDGDAKSPERRYSPGQCIGAVPTVINGNPDPTHFDQLRGAPELDGSHDDAPLHAAVERFQPQD